MVSSKLARQYHQCTYRRIPYISPPLETAQFLLSHNCSFIRFGDSEVLLARGYPETFQYADENLASNLTAIFKTSSPQHIALAIYDAFSNFPMWMHPTTDWWIDTQKDYQKWVMKNIDWSRQYFSAMISSTYVHTYGTFCALLPQLYDTLRQIWDKKHVVILRGDNKQVFRYDIYDNAQSQTIILAPRYHAWAAYAKLKEQLLTQDPESLYILTAGPVSRVLAYDLSLTGRRALDLGHLAKDYDLFKRQEKPCVSCFFERNETIPCLFPDKHSFECKSE